MNLLERRVRGFRLVDLVALGVLTALVFGVYLAKTMAGRERTEIATVERRIDSEKARIRLLQAKVTHLEQPTRIEHLSEAYLGLAPVSMHREVELASLAEIARKPITPPPPKPVEAAATPPVDPESPDPTVGETPAPEPTVVAAR